MERTLSKQRTASSRDGRSRRASNWSERVQFHAIKSVNDLQDQLKFIAFSGQVYCECDLIVFHDKLHLCWEIILFKWFRQWSFEFKSLADKVIKCWFRERYQTTLLSQLSNKIMKILWTFCRRSISNFVTLFFLENFSKPKRSNEGERNVDYPNRDVTSTCVSFRSFSSALGVRLEWMKIWLILLAYARVGFYRICVCRFSLFLLLDWKHKAESIFWQSFRRRRRNTTFLSYSHSWPQNRLLIILRKKVSVVVTDKFSRLHEIVSLNPATVTSNWIEL